jgi:hypothetical protein
MIVFLIDTVRYKTHNKDMHLSEFGRSMNGEMGTQDGLLPGKRRMHILLLFTTM